MQLLGQGKFYYLVDSSKPLDDPDILPIKAVVMQTPDQCRYKSIMEQVTVDTRTGERMWWMRPWFMPAMDAAETVNMARCYEVSEAEVSVPKHCACHR